MVVLKGRRLVHMAIEDNSGGNEDGDGASSEHNSGGDLHEQQPAEKKRKAVSYSRFIQLIVGYRVHVIVFLQVTRKVCKKGVNPAKDDGTHMMMTNQ